MQFFNLLAPNTNLTNILYEQFYEVLPLCAIADGINCQNIFNNIILLIMIVWNLPLRFD